MLALSKNKIYSTIQNISKAFLQYREQDNLFFPFFRISIGLFFLVHLVSVLSDFKILFTNQGLIPLDVISVLGVNNIPSLNLIFKISNKMGIDYISVMYTFITLYVLFCLTLILGFMSRISAFFLLFFHILLFQSSSTYMYGLDFFKSIAMFYCVVFPVGSKLSLDNKIFRKKEYNPSPYRNLLRVHLSIVYCTSGLDKAFGINWWNGESIWKALHLPGFQSYIIDNYDLLSSYPIIPTIIGISTIFLELLYPFFIWNARTRQYTLMLIISLHIGIIIAMNLYFFGAFMILLNLSAFMDLSDKKQVYATK